MSDSIGTLFFKEKQLRLLLTLSNGGTREWYITDLAKAADVTYIHTSRFVSRCEESGMLASERHGRIKRIFLTKEGREIAESLSGVMLKIGQAKQQMAQPKAPPARAESVPQKVQAPQKEKEQ